MGINCCRLLNESKDEHSTFTRSKNGHLIKVEKIRCADGSVMKKLSTIFEEDENQISKKSSFMSIPSTNKFVGIYQTEKVAAAPV
ncbi:unnamed protein product [Bursaphelenchus xylophilus]|uniref:(pine wood nematode) hypothetical protein n=1 Tax=Bursaphelenchus xylophilus TaxID=6326 RepID=A0A1I7S041_BURXY|nr:unnamed protein product [Bursaphelenchus xylophilus]CAG9109034.1 unnamed protein product [Bursaphelenchus xylophilus]